MLPVETNFRSRHFSEIWRQIVLEVLRNYQGSTKIALTQQSLPRHAILTLLIWCRLSRLKSTRPGFEPADVSDQELVVFKPRMALQLLLVAVLVKISAQARATSLSTSLLPGNAEAPLFSMRSARSQ